MFVPIFRRYKGQIPPSFLFNIEKRQYCLSESLIACFLTVNTLVIPLSGLKMEQYFWRDKELNNYRSV